MGFKQHSKEKHNPQRSFRELLIKYYFVDDSTYGHMQFPRRFCMRKGLFMRLLGNMKINYPYFQTTWDATNQRIFNALQKMHTSNTSVNKGL
uniref:Uncharacterized protein n=1 Tax=Lactuca sativa TaxID=4236 RepID=A0A9R1V7K1_LACSA|nr:hypothetical protein LSAT_V11C600336290 [Lactuca sativa]